MALGGTASHLSEDGGAGGSLSSNRLFAAHGKKQVKDPAPRANDRSPGRHRYALLLLNFVMWNYCNLWAVTAANFIASGYGT
jgi:hypothetical protein